MDHHYALSDYITKRALSEGAPLVGYTKLEEVSCNLKAEV